MVAKTAPKSTAPQAAPKPPAPPIPPMPRQESTGTAVAPYQQFKGELDRRHDEIASLLPSTLTWEAFQNVAIIAAKQNPELLDCDRRSLHKAITMAARDGLMPDAKEGVILPQWETIKDKVTGKESKVRTARWQSMVYGVRKRARQLDGIIIDAQEVRKNDYFKRRQGDNPSIEHEPPDLGTDRGALVGAYAIIRKDGDILHREVMDVRQIETVRQISRQPNGLMWAKFTEEAYKKTVVRRAMKSVPCSEALRSVIEADDDLYDVSERPQAPPAPPAPPPRPAIQQKPQQQDVTDIQAEDVGPAMIVDQEAYVVRLDEEITVAGDAAGRLEAWQAHMESQHQRLSPEYQKRCEELRVKYKIKVEA